MLITSAKRHMAKLADHAPTPSICLVVVVDRVQGWGQCGTWPAVGSARPSAPPMQTLSQPNALQQQHSACGASICAGQRGCHPPRLPSVPDGNNWQLGCPGFACAVEGRKRCLPPTPHLLAANGPNFHFLYAREVALISTVTANCVCSLRCAIPACTP